LLDRTVDLHCIGGFAVTMQYGVSRATADVDVLAASVPPQELETIQRLAGKGSNLHKQFKVYVQPVAVAPYPENYPSRLVRMWPNFILTHLRLFALEAHDLALTKIDRNSDVDRQDIADLAKKGLIKGGTLRKRYEEELRPNFVGRVEKLDLTLELWADVILEVSQGSR
jgi:Nucleotidyltransferase of unknown function (DUF6036)